MKNGRFGPFWAVFVGREGWKMVAEGPKMAQTGWFCAAFFAFFGSFLAFLSTPNFQKALTFENLALTFESEKAANFEKFSLIVCCLDC